MTEISKPYILKKIAPKKIVSQLNAHASNNFSQDGEDGIISKIFELIGLETKYFVEFGAWDGKFLSNCFNLSNTGWSGCFIEANHKKFQELIKNHGSNNKIKCINKFVTFEGESSLDNILVENEAPVNLDLISIDVDGTDYFIWESLKVYRPKLLVIEFNPSIPNDVLFVQEKNSKINQGCSLLALIELGKVKGYELVCCTGWNAFFVPKELLGVFNLKSNSINDMYVPVSDGRIFHGYDSTIYVCGMPKLLWSEIEVDAEEFQIMPKSMRTFGDKQT